MATERNVVDFKIHNLTEEQFQELKAQGKIDPNAVYCTPDESLKVNQITNCITEIPQDIKLELTGGTLTLKAGSKAYRPNGSGVFDIITISSDKTLTNTTDGTYVVCVTSGGGMIQRDISKCVSGATRSLTTTYMLWYDTTNNVINNYASDSSTPAQTVSLPIAIITVSDGAISSIDQVFNGFGYIGSTVFVLPEVKGLIPNGRNEDGTLKNTILNVTSVQARNFTGTQKEGLVLTASGMPSYFQLSQIAYDPEKNLNYRTSDKSILSAGLFGSFSLSSGLITSFNPKPAFHAVDYKDFEDTVEELDNSVVHKTGDETISGTKTFLANTVYKRDIDQSVLPSTNKYVTWSTVQDKNGKYLSYIETTQFNTGDVSQAFGARREDSNGTKHTASITVKVNSDFTKSYRLSESPASTSNSTDIATTAWSNAKFLPLAGGTMSGPIVQTGYLAAIKKDTNDTYVDIYGGTTPIKSATLSLYGKDSNEAPGAFYLSTGDGNKAIYLSGKPDGTLMWDGVYVATTKAKSLAQNGYVKFNNGLIIQWGLTEQVNGVIVVTFPVPFTGQYTYAVTATLDGKSEKAASVQARTNTTFSVDPATGHDSAHKRAAWIAIGY
jgi:hypothetical protein